ncbi:hypothetical protein T08_12811 [Trichinella sp. T8]|uniref:Uncharacterized protein n=1 Tax=Trichinella murrelli TaxID=144512 RepID=A0A0V0T624_9BILA|nr:hypothetical protein T05_2006 [Trichinella murrelli]KRZ89775.1 hypothetical protein T08_12811 [Trichinella sp. T8]
MPSRRADFGVRTPSRRADFAISGGKRWRTINHSTCQ